MRLNNWFIAAFLVINDKLLRKLLETMFLDHLNYLAALLIDSAENVVFLYNKHRIVT